MKEGKNAVKITDSSPYTSVARADIIGDTDLAIDITLLEAPDNEPFSECFDLCIISSMLTFLNTEVAIEKGIKKIRKVYIFGARLRPRKQVANIVNPCSNRL